MIFWTACLFEGSANCYYWGWFIVGNRLVLLQVVFIWYGSHSVFELKLVLGMWRWNKFDCWPIIKNCLSCVIFIRLLETVESDFLVDKIRTKQSKWYIYRLVLCLCHQFNWYFYPLLIIATCVSFILVLSNRIKTRQKRYWYYDWSLGFIIVRFTRNDFHPDQIAQRIERQVRYHAIINITVGFISLILLLLIILFSCFKFFTTKKTEKRNLVNIFGVPDVIF